MKQEIYDRIRREAEKILIEGGIKIDEKIRENIDALLFELGVHQIELELQNEELINTKIELEKTKSAYYNIFEQAPVGYVVLNEKLDIVEVNLEASSMLKQEKEKLVGKSFLLYLSSDHREPFINLANYSIHSASKVNGEFVINSGDSEIPVFAGLISFRFVEEDLPFLFVSLSDVSRLKEAEQKLEKLNIELEERVKLRTKQLEDEICERKRVEEELREANVVKDKIYSIIAHDLIVPFNAIIGMSEVLKDEFDLMSDEEKLNFVSHINKAGKNLFGLLSNLLNWANLQKGRIRINAELFNVYNVVQDVIGLFEDNFRDKKLSIENLLPEDLVGYADKNMISIVVSNLLSNAIKFSKIGGMIRIYFEDSLDECKILVEDNGVGISEEHLAKIFDGDSFSVEVGTMMEKGSGLGLKICKEFVAKNGGKLGAKSIYGQGSTFWFTIPKAIK